MYSLKVFLLISFSISLHGFEIFDDQAEKVSKRSLPLEGPSNDSSEEKDEPNEWERYLEENENWLLGSNALITLAKRNESVINHANPSFVTYTRTNFSINDAQEIEHTVTHSEVKLRFVRSLDPSSTKREKNSKREEKSKKKRVYLKILVVIDFYTYWYHNKDVSMITTYISSLLNGVDLRFRQMKNPEVRLNIAGIIISEDIDSTFYLENYDQSFHKIADLIIYDIFRYFHRSYPKNNDADYDIVLGIVQNDLWFESRKIEALADAKLNWDWKLPLAVIVAGDDGHLSSLMPITRTLGYVLGAPYDATGNISMDPCIEKDANLLSNELKNGLLWSNCSINAMQNFLNNRLNVQNGRLKKEPNVGSPMIKKLPGKLYNRKEQCKSISSDSRPDETKEENCVKLECQTCTPYTSFIRDTFGSNIFCSSTTENTKNIPADGSSCGVGKICLNGECVHDTMFMERVI